MKEMRGKVKWRMCIFVSQEVGKIRQDELRKTLKTMRKGNRGMEVSRKEGSGVF